MTKQISITNANDLKAAQRHANRAVNLIDKVMSALEHRGEDFSLLNWERNKCRIISDSIDEFLKKSEVVCGIKRGVNGG